MNDIYQKKRRRRVKYELDSMLIVRDDELDISRSRVHALINRGRLIVVNTKINASPTPAFSETHVLRTICWVNSVHLAIIFQKLSVSDKGNVTRMSRMSRCCNQD